MRFSRARLAVTTAPNLGTWRYLRQSFSGLKID